MPSGSGGQAADGPALFRAEPADVTLLATAGVAGDDLQLGFQILESQLALQAMQCVIGVGDGDELDVGQIGTQLTGQDQAADGQIGLALGERLLDAGQHLLAQQYAATAALRHEGGEGFDHLAGRIGGVQDQAYLGFPALLHVMSQFLELAGLLDQLPRAAQEQGACFGEHCLASVDAQQRYAELLLHAGDRVADRRLRAVQCFGRLSEAAVVDDRLQGTPLLESYAGGFHRPCS